MVHCYIAREDSDGFVEAVYCHEDGYPEHILGILQNLAPEQLNRFFCHADTKRMELRGKEFEYTVLDMPDLKVAMRFGITDKGKPVMIFEDSDQSLKRVETSRFENPYCYHFLNMKELISHSDMTNVDYIFMYDSGSENWLTIDVEEMQRQARHNKEKD